MASTVGIVAVVLGAVWYVFFGLKSYKVSEQDIKSRYSYQAPSQLQMEIRELSNTRYAFTYNSFDGAKVNGEIHYPAPINELNKPSPVLLCLHAMGRSHVRCWQDRIDDRLTLENTHRLTEQALQQGYTVIGIDARNHGERKDPDLSIIEIINDLHWWGKREPYESMLVNSVKDYRVLLDWVSQQNQFDTEQIHVAGYSMGAHISLLLAANEPRINRVLAIVPPYMNDRTAIVSPISMITGLADNPVWLLTSNDDEYASKKQNKNLFEALPNKDKLHFTFDSGHLLPEYYLEKTKDWF